MPAKLSKADRDAITADVQYLNLAEMRTLCRAHGLPLHIHVRKPDGGLRRTGDRDRKDIVLQRILDLALHGRRTGPTVYSHEVVREEPLPAKLNARTRLHYGQFDKKHDRLLATMQRLTDGSFRFGMIARLVLRDFWTAGKAPTLKQFAVAWQQATNEHKQPRPEGAYLVDLWRGDAGPDWKKVRVQRAKRALAKLEKLLS